MGVGKCRKWLTKAEGEGLARPDLEAEEGSLPTKDRMACARARSCGDFSPAVGPGCA